MKSAGYAALLLWAMAACGAPTRIWMAGDVQVEDDPARILAALAELEGAGIVNLEGPVLPARPPGKDRLHNHVDVPAALKKLGVVAVSLANNHADDGGPGGRAASRSALKINGLAAVEGYAELDGFSVVAAWNLAPEALAAAVRAAPRPVIVSLHVLASPGYVPSPETRAQVEAALTAGAAVVAVHGSHALAKVERRGRQIVAWGLGNVAFSCTCTMEDEGMALEVTLDEDGAQSAAVVPLRAGLHGQPVQIEPEPAGIFDLLEALGSSPLKRQGHRASF